MSAIVSAMSKRLFDWTNRLLRGHRNVASVVTILILCVLVIAPLIGIAYLAAEQASGLAKTAVATVDKISKAPETIQLPDWIPLDRDMEELGPEIASRLGNIISAVTGFFVSALSAITRGTAVFFLNLFVFLYAMFFFLQMEVSMIDRVLSYTMLRDATQKKLSDRIVSVSRATIKGTLLIGALQGLLGGLGFWAVGIGNSAFWGVVMAIASVIPGIGAGAVITVAVIYLLAVGSSGAAIALALWGALVVTSIDNVLRPILVGRDAKMPDIVILVSTLGGLGYFGAVGLVLGPVMAGLFMTIWSVLQERVSAGSWDDTAETASDAEAG
jgi:predicted PurR-regulated permease PerM